MANDWTTLTKVPALSTGDEEQKWVEPETFFDVLPIVLAAAPPLPGEEGRYAQVRAVLDAAQGDPTLQEVMVKAAVQVDAELVTPLLQFRH